MAESRLDQVLGVRRPSRASSMAETSQVEVEPMAQAGRATLGCVCGQAKSSSTTRFGRLHPGPRGTRVLGAESACRAWLELGSQVWPTRTPLVFGGPVQFGLGQFWLWADLVQYQIRACLVWARLVFFSFFQACWTGAMDPGWHTWIDLDRGRIRRFDLGPCIIIL